MTRLGRVEADLIGSADVSSYERLWERLDQVALPEKRSIDLLAKTIKQIIK